VSDQDPPVKVASVYKEFTLPLGDPGGIEMTYNDDFINTFTRRGKVMAFNFDGGYYLLSHEGPPGFEPASLRLKELNSSQTYDVSVGGLREGSFIVPEGKFIIETDPVNEDIFFKVETAEFLAEEAEREMREELVGGDYSIVLSLINSVTVGGATIEMCENIADYSEVSAAEVCINSRPVIVDVGEDYHIEEDIGGQDYLLEVNGQEGVDKRVTIRRIIDIKKAPQPPLEVVWSDFTDHILAGGDKPIIRVEEDLYLPTAMNNLLTGFALQSYPAGAIAALRNVQQITAITFNGSFVLNDKIVFVEQERAAVGRDVSVQQTVANFVLRGYSYLPDDNSKIYLNRTNVRPGLNFPMYFTSDLDPTLYNFRVMGEVNPHLVKLWLELNDAAVLFRKHFAEGDSKILILDGALIEIKLEHIEVNEDEQVDSVGVSIKRII